VARVLRRAEVEDLAESLRRLQKALESEEVASTPTYRARVEGALAALEAVLGKRSADDLKANDRLL